MSYHEDVELLERYMPLISAELRRIGVSAEDERWIHAGTNLAAGRALPTNMGVRAYCNWLGFDYDDAKRKLAAHSTPPNEEL
jgi:hypothetical protein